MDGDTTQSPIRGERGVGRWSNTVPYGMTLPKLLKAMNAKMLWPEKPVLIATPKLEATHQWEGGPVRGVSDNQEISKPIEKEKPAVRIVTQSYQWNRHGTNAERKS